MLNTSTLSTIISHRHSSISGSSIFNCDELKKAVEVLQAINHSLRREIIKLLEKNEILAVTEIYIKLRIEQSIASQHLAALRKAGVVKTERDGKFIFYSLNRGRIRELNELI